MVSTEEPKVAVTKTLETAVEELTTGSTFAERYQIIEELGKGGMGRVYKARDSEIREKVALKLLKPEIAADEKTSSRVQCPNPGRSQSCGSEMSTETKRRTVSEC